MVKKHVLLSVAFLLIFMGTSISGENINYLKSGIGLETYYHEYKEPGIMKNDGFFYGISYFLSYENDVLLKFEGLLSYGQVDYSSSSTGEADDIDDICADTRAIIGYTLYDDTKIKVTPFSGVGYRFLQDDSENEITTTNNIGYLRESNYYYTPVGLKVVFKYDSGWTLSPEIEYDYFWSGEQESYLGYVAGYEDIENDQEDGYGYRASLTLVKKTPGLGYSFKIFYRYWDIDDSEITTDSFGRSWIEPDNETVEYGFNMSILF